MWPQHSLGKRSADRTPPPLTFLKKSKSPKYPWLTNHPSLPARVATQTVYRVLWPAHRLLMISGLWCMICDLINSEHLCCPFLFWIQQFKSLCCHVCNTWIAIVKGPHQKVFYVLAIKYTSLVLYIAANHVADHAIVLKSSYVFSLLFQVSIGFH